MKRSTMRKIRGILIIVAVIATGQSVALGASWWNPQWNYRVSVELPDKPLKATLPGENVAVVDFRTCSHIQKNGEDIRVTTSTGREIPHRVLMTGPGDLVKVAFATRKGVAKYYVYFGNPEAAPPKKPLEIRRGVLLEMWKYRGGGGWTYKQLKKTLQLAQKEPPIGRCFRRWIFNGHNPFGSQSALATVYTGYFEAPEDGKYLFVTSSQHASFLLIDDKVVVRNGGWHGPQRNVRIRGAITLRAGLHKLSFEQVSTGWYPVAVVAWRPPGQQKITLVPPAVFAPIVRGVPGAIQKYGRSKSIDFHVTNGGETFVENRYYQRRVFRTISAGISPQQQGKLNPQWDFGDGQTAKGRQVEHVYLKPGLYKVTLQTKTSPRTLTRTHQVQIDRNWDTVIVNRLDKLSLHEQIVSQYNFDTLQTESLTEALLLFRRTKNVKMMLRVCKAFFKRNSATDAELKVVVPICEKLLVSENSPALGVRALTKAASMTKTPDLAAGYLIRAGKLQMEELADPTSAMQIYLDVLKDKKNLSESTLRLARIGLGDIWRDKGNYKLALSEYEKAGIPANHRTGAKLVLRGDLARQVEDYIRTRDFISAAAALDKWEQAFPCDKLEGYSTLLRVKLLRAQRRYSPAARLGQIVAGVNPDGSYAAELLMLSADSYFKANQPLKTRSILKKIVEDYPESPLYPEAVEMLNEDR